MKITKNNIDDETVEFYIIDDKRKETFIGNFNHDEHGWAGIRAAEEIIETIAKVAKIEIEESFE